MSVRLRTPKYGAFSQQGKKMYHMPFTGTSETLHNIGEGRIGHFMHQGLGASATSTSPIVTPLGLTHKDPYNEQH